MILDLSGAVRHAQDLLSTSDEYLPHDPKLAAELSLKAFEICREFGIDVASLDRRMVSASHWDFLENRSAAQQEGPALEDQADELATIVDDHKQLQSIMDHQKALIEAQNASADGESDPKKTESQQGWAGLFNALIRPQPA